MKFFGDAILAAVFSAICIITLKYLCIEGNKNIVRPLLNVVLLGAVVFILVFVIGNLKGNENFKLIRPKLTINNYENKMYCILIVYFLISFLFVLFSLRSFYFVENPAFTQAVIYSNLVFIYLFSVYFFGSKLTLQSSLGILLVFVGICLITVNSK